MAKKRIEFSFSVFQCLFLGAGSALVLMLTFVLGLLVGREMGGMPLLDKDVKSEVVKMRIDAPAAVQLSAPAASNTGSASGSAAEPLPKPDITFYDTLSKKEGEIMEPAVAKTTPPVRKEDPKTAAKSKELYTIQVGAMKDKEFAEKLLNKLKKAGYSAYMEEKGSLHKVRVGTFSSKEAAAKEVEKFKRNEGIEAAVVGK